MRALRYHGTRDLRLETIPEPTLQTQYSIKIRPAYVGICGSDLHEYLHQQFIPSSDKPHPVTGESAPVTLGHEFSGVVVEIGVGVTKAKVGDHVVVMPIISCGKCEMCLGGFVNCCPVAGFVGLHGWGGGLSDFVVVEEELVFVIPKEIGLDVGALVEPLAVSWHAVEAANAGPEDEVLVLGAGPIGAGVIQCLKAKGVKTVVVSEISAVRSELAKAFGATHVLNPLVDDVVVRTKELCSSVGPRIAIDCAGVPSSIRTACVVVKSQGRIVNVAVWPKEVLFQPNELIHGEKTFSAVLAYQRKDFEGVIQALSNGSLKPSAMITKRIAIDRVVEDGFDALLEKENTQVKILVDLAKEPGLLPQ